jgi:hypothetical protein
MGVPPHRQHEDFGGRVRVPAAAPPPPPPPRTGQRTYGLRRRATTAPAPRVRSQPAALCAGVGGGRKNVAVWPVNLSRF